MATGKLRGVLGAGERVSLRSPCAGDREEFLRFVRESMELHRPWIYAPETAEDFEEWLGRAGDARNEAFLVVLGDTGEIVGVIQFSEIVYGSFRNAYTGYYGSRRHARRGYMREGLELSLRHAFTRMGLHRLEANVQPGNQASRRLVESLGFRLEGLSPRYLKIGGRWRDHERWAILAEDWRARRRALRRARAGPGAG